MSDTEYPYVSNLEMATVMLELPAHLPISDEYESWDWQRKDRWWASQREHMISWFYSRTCVGGFPKYEARGKLDARDTYRYLGCPAALIWIAEAFGVDRQTLRKASDAGLRALREEKQTRARCNDIRKVIPWSMIAPLARELVDRNRIHVEPAPYPPLRA